MIEIKKSQPLIKQFIFTVCFIASVPICQAAVQISEQKNLSGELVDGGDAAVAERTPYAISADEKFVVFTADKDEDETIELYSVPSAGGEATKLNSNLVDNGDVKTFFISPDSQWVVYVADQIQDTKNEMFSVPIAGGDVINLTPSLAEDGDVGGFRSTQVKIGPLSERVIFVADTDGSTRELYSVSINGGEATLLSEPGVENGGVSTFQLTPDGQQVIFTGSLNASDVNELYRNAIEGGEFQKLSPQIANPTFEDVFSFQISPDGQYVAFTGDLDTEDVSELYFLPLAGGATNKVSGMLVAGGSVKNIFQFSPDSQTLVFLADKDNPNIDELYSVRYTDFPSIQVEQVSQNISPAGVLSTDFKITPDSTRVVYSADVAGNERYQLFSNSMIGDDLLLYFFSMQEPNVRPLFTLTPDGKKIVYRADIQAGVYQLYAVDVEGGPSVRINGTFFLPQSDVGLHFEITNNGKGVIYQADQEVDEKIELYYSSIDGQGASSLDAVENVKLSHEDALFDDVAGFITSLTTHLIVYEHSRILLNGDLVKELYGVSFLKDDELCLPIKSHNAKVVVICL